MASSAQADVDHDGADAIAERIGSGNAVAGKGKAEAGRCLSCHGADGNSALPDTPKLAGQYADYIVNQVNHYQAGERRHPALKGGATAIPEADIADIAAYFTSQPSMKGPAIGPAIGPAKGPATDPAAAASQAARNLYAHGDLKRDVLACASCHGDKGKSTFAGSDSNPVIGGQHAAYLRAQLASFRAGERHGAGGVMNIVAKSLRDDEIEALSSYLAGLQ